MKKDTLLFHSLIWAVFVTAFVIMVYFFYLLVFPFKTIEVLNEPMPITPVLARRGDEMVVTVHYIKYRDSVIKTDRTIECEDGNLVTLTPVERSFPLGENIVLVNHLELPEKVSDGQCKLVFTVKYEVNHFRTILHRFETEYFTVLPKEE